MLTLAGLLPALAPRAARADLDAYLAKPEPAYRWEKRGEEKRDGCTIYDLHLVSQTWQGMEWEHRLQIFRPDKLIYPDFCALYNTGGGGSESNTRLGIRAATATGTVCATVYGIPKQPLYDGKVEDELVVYTWLKYLETGDESWPLHFPMAKAVLKAMDAIQAFTKENRQPSIDRFLVFGASKRGWTSWLVGASRDLRVKAIAPMVIDVLNVAKQAAHQRESYGTFSEQVDDYTKMGIPEKLATPAGRRLLELEDPYSYRERLTLPKLIILGTNDRYWTQDALNLYWDDLKGPKWVLYLPNSGHGMEDRDRLFATLGAFVRRMAGGGKWPKLRWSYAKKDGGVELRLTSDIRPKEARLFSVQAPTRDFRESRWSYTAMEPAGKGFKARYGAPPLGFAAIFGEAVYEIDGQPFTLSTQIRILSSTAAPPGKTSKAD
jgi:PhoPQ-activated pathogenicity-related protein